MCHAEGNRRCDAANSLSLDKTKGGCGNGTSLATLTKRSAEECQLACRDADGCKFSSHCASPPSQWVPLLELAGQRCNTFEVAPDAKCECL